MVHKLRLAHVPTPLWRNDGLDALVGAEVWVKRDDMTGGVEAGNKIRKLEYLLAEARACGAAAVVTCGGLQSNHARATAILARQLGMRAILFLRCSASLPPSTERGNAFLDALAGAEIRFITAEQYRERNALMADAAAELAAGGEQAYVIPEGGSSGLGALGYVDAMAELREQLDAGLSGAPREFDAVVHACGSGGTAAGVALGAAQSAIAPRTWAIAVCDDRTYFEAVTAKLIAEARTLEPALGAPNQLEILDRFKGPAYGVVSDEQARFIVQVARALSGVLSRPVALRSRNGHR